MKVILCLDDNNGMAFGGRRQSRDRVQRQKLLELCCGSRILMNSYSGKLFDGTEDIVISEDFLNLAGEEDFCFCETVIPDISKVKELYIFRWNRVYPSDLKFKEDISGFELRSSEEFKGSSHEKMELNIYKR